MNEWWVVRLTLKMTACWILDALKLQLLFQEYLISINVESYLSQFCSLPL